TAEEVEHERRGPRELARAVAVAAQWREVLEATGAVHEFDRARREFVGRARVTARAEAFDDQPVRVHPCWALPVRLFAETRVIGRHRGDRIPRCEAGRLQTAAQRRRARLWYDLTEQRHERRNGRQPYEITGGRVARVVLLGVGVPQRVDRGL